jgi:hypothetical protein
MDPRHACFTSERMPTSGHPYHWSRVELRFPASDLAQDLRTQTFRLQIRIPGRAPVVVANCRIPNTRAAAQRLYARFASIFAGRARLEPLLFVGPGSERRLYLTGRRSPAPVPTGPHFDTAPGDVQLPGVTAYGTPTYEGGATGWTGQTDWGWAPPETTTNPAGATRTIRERRPIPLTMTTPPVHNVASEPPHSRSSMR